MKNFCIVLSILVGLFVLASCAPANLNSQDVAANSKQSMKHSRQKREIEMEDLAEYHSSHGHHSSSPHKRLQSFLRLNMFLGYFKSINTLINDFIEFEFMTRLLGLGHSTPSIFSLFNGGHYEDDDDDDDDEDHWVEYEVNGKHSDPFMDMFETALESLEDRQEGKSESKQSTGKSSATQNKGQNSGATSAESSAASEKGNNDNSAVNSKSGPSSNNVQGSKQSNGQKSISKSENLGDKSRGTQTKITNKNNNNNGGLQNKQNTVKQPAINTNKAGKSAANQKGTTNNNVGPRGGSVNTQVTKQAKIPPAAGTAPVGPKNTNANKITQLNQQVTNQANVAVGMRSQGMNKVSVQGSSSGTAGMVSSSVTGKQSSSNVGVSSTSVNGKQGLFAKTGGRASASFPRGQMAVNGKRAGTAKVAVSGGISKSFAKGQMAANGKLTVGAPVQQSVTGPSSVNKGSFAKVAASGRASATSAKSPVAGNNKMAVGSAAVGSAAQRSASNRNAVSDLDRAIVSNVVKQTGAQQRTQKVAKMAAVMTSTQIGKGATSQMRGSPGQMSRGAAMSSAAKTSAGVAIQHPLAQQRGPTAVKTTATLVKVSAGAPASPSIAQNQQMNAVAAGRFVTSSSKQSGQSRGNKFTARFSRGQGITGTGFPVGKGALPGQKPAFNPRPSAAGNVGSGKGYLTPRILTKGTPVNAGVISQRNQSTQVVRKTVITKTNSRPVVASSNLGKGPVRSSVAIQG